MSFCLISAKLISSGFCKIQNLSNCCKKQVWPVNFTENVLLRFCYLTCLGLKNYLISKFWLPFIGVISAIVQFHVRTKQRIRKRAKTYITSWKDFIGPATDPSPDIFAPPPDIKTEENVLALRGQFFRGKRKNITQTDISEQDFNTLNENLKLITYEVLKYICF